MAPIVMLIYSMASLIYDSAFIVELLHGELTMARFLAVCLLVASSTGTSMGPHPLGTEWVQEVVLQLVWSPIISEYWQTESNGFVFSTLGNICYGNVLFPFLAAMAHVKNWYLVNNAMSSAEGIILR